MRRRKFVKSAITAATVYAASHAFAPFARASDDRLNPMAIGLLVKPAPADPNAVLSRVKQLGFTNCFLSLDTFLGKFTPDLAQQMRASLDKYNLVATAAEVVHPEPLKWNFMQGPSTIGIVPRAYRAARVDALKQTSDFARLAGIPNIQTHCGFMPENPEDPLYPEVVATIRDLARHCQSNGQSFLMETGQETPVTMLRVIRDVNMPNLGVGLDTANLILYGKANPVDAVEILGPHIKATHMKDGKWPTNPSELGTEVLIGNGDVDFKQVLSRLRHAGYTGPLTIERETSGPQQIEDVKAEKLYLEHVLSQI